MADNKLIDFIKAYQDIRPETAGINPYEVDSREAFMQMAEGMKPDVRERAMRDANRYKYVLPEDYEYPGISPQDRADSYGVVGGDNPFTKNPTRRKQNIIDMIERGEMSALDYNLPGMRAEGQVTDKAAQKINPNFKAGILEEMYSNRDKMSMGPRYETLTEGKTPSYMLSEDGSRKTKEKEYKGPFPKRKPTIKKEKVKAKTEKEKFVEKDTVLGRMFDKRIRPGAETSSRNKMFTYMDEIGKNLVERRVKGDKSSTLDRVLGGVIEGKDAVIAKDKKEVARKAAAVDKALKNRKTAYEIQKISSESMKNIAELAKTDFTKATQAAMELAEFENFEPGTQKFNDQVAAILRGAVTEGQANVYTKLMQLQKELAILPKGSPDYIAMENDIAEMKQRVSGTTLNNNASDQLIDADGNPIT